MSATWVGRACPKCGYIRTLADTNPDWQCPRCQVVYEKVISSRENIGEKLSDHVGRMAERAASDYSLLGLIASNALALVLAWLTHMTLRDLMLAYWIQSVVIGAANVVRIWKLHDFSTEGMQMNGRPVPETEGSKYYVAIFFAFHYGFFHLVYFMFLTVRPEHGLGSAWAYFALAASFAVSHFYSLKHNIESDASGRPKLGVLMFMPYARIVPMHIMIIAGVAFSHDGPAALPTLLFFGTLKTVADAFMHTFEHHVMAQTGSENENPA